MARKQLQGTIVSNKMQKTAVVLVGSIKESKKYKRRYKNHKRYKAQAEEIYNLGDIVLIEECQPISKGKRWKVIKKIAAKESVDNFEPQEEISQGIPQETPGESSNQ